MDSGLAPVWALTELTEKEREMNHSLRFCFGFASSEVAQNPFWLLFGFVF